MIKKIIFLITLLLHTITFAQVGIGTQTPSAKSILDLTATNKGFLLPRMTTTERTNIAPNTTTDKGMQVFDTTTNSIWFWNGITWVESGVAGLGDITNDAFINNATNTRVELGSNSDGTAVRGTGTEFVINDNGTVGIGTNSPDSSAALDIQSNTKGLLPPRMTKEERDGIVSPASGLVVYCTDCNNGDGCLVYNYGTPADPKWECVGQPKGAIVSVDCAGSSINGNYVKDVANTAANTITIKVDNNTFSSISANFTNKLTLSGAVPGLTVTGPTPAQPVTIAAGSSQILTYTITGTPTASGSFTARFSGNGLECVKNGTILASAVIPDCGNSFVYGLTPLKYLKQNTTYTGGKVRIPYTTTQNIAYLAQTITLPSGLTLTRSAGTFTAPSGFVEYTIGGTYAGSDCSSVTANIVLHNDQSCNVTIGEGHSSYLSGVYTSSSLGYGGNCPASQTAMTDRNYTTGWASPDAAANQWVEITFPSMAVKQVVLSGGAIPCWGSYAPYVSYYSNFAGLQLEYWNGTSWVGITSVPTLNQDQLTTINVTCNSVNTTKLRVRNNVAQIWGLGTFYPVGYWDSKVTPPTLNCSNAIVALTPNNALVNGQAYTGTVTINYTSTLEAGFGSETVSRSGLTLTRGAGTMVNGSGSITYNVSGTYTGSSFGTQSFPISLMGGSCNVVLGNPTPFLTGTYTASSTGLGGTCPATQTAMTDNNFSTGWASPNTAASQWIEINLGTSRQVKSIVASGGSIPCWGGNSVYVAAYANVAGLVFEAWNGTNWISMTSVNNNLTQNSLTTYNLTTPVTTSRIRVRNTTAQWWGLGTFYPFVF